MGQGRLLGDREFQAHHGRYRQLLSSLGQHGQVGMVRVEGTVNYGASLAATYLTGPEVVEATGRQTYPAAKGRSHSIDAEAPSAPCLPGSRPRSQAAQWDCRGDLRLATVCEGASKARTAAINQPRRCWSPRQPRSARRSMGWSVGRSRLLQLLAIGNDHARQLLTIGQHPERLRGEAAFGHLCGLPHPRQLRPDPPGAVYTGGGDRDANRALHLP